MAIKYWLGGSDTHAGGTGTSTDPEIAFDNQNNWSDSTLPSAGDTIIFDSRANVVTAAEASMDGQTLGNHISPAENLDYFSTTAFTAIYVQSSFTGNIGWLDTSDSSKNYMYCDVTNAYITGGGSVYLQTGNASYMSLNSSTTAVYICNDSDGSWSIDAVSGTVQANTDASSNEPDITLINCLGGTVSILDGGSVTTLMASSGTIYSEADVNSLTIGSADVNFGNSTTDSDISITCTELITYGGTLTINTTTTIIDAEMYAGAVEVNTADAITLGDISGGDITLYGGTFDLSDAGYGQVTLNSEIDIRNGNFYAAPGTTISF